MHMYMCMCFMLIMLPKNLLGVADWTGEPNSGSYSWVEIWMDE